MIVRLFVRGYARDFLVFNQMHIQKPEQGCIGVCQPDVRLARIVLVPGRGPGGGIPDVVSLERKRLAADMNGTPTVNAKPDFGRIVAERSCPLTGLQHGKPNLDARGHPLSTLTGHGMHNSHLPLNGVVDVERQQSFCLLRNLLLVDDNRFPEGVCTGMGRVSGDKSGVWLCHGVILTTVETKAAPVPALAIRAPRCWPVPPGKFPRPARGRQYRFRRI